MVVAEEAEEKKEKFPSSPPISAVRLPFPANSKGALQAPALYAEVGCRRLHAETGSELFRGEDFTEEMHGYLLAPMDSHLAK